MKQTNKKNMKKKTTKTTKIKKNKNLRLNAVVRKMCKLVLVDSDKAREKDDPC